MTLKHRQIASVFKNAKKYLEKPDGSCERGRGYQSKYICWCIEDTCEIRSIQEAAKKVIQSRLGFIHNDPRRERRTVEYYLTDVLKIDGRSMTRRRVQEYRHAWLDSLIEEFSSKKD